MGSRFPQGVIPLQPPSRVAFLTTSTDDILLAVGYRAHPILVWDALGLDLLGLCDSGTENNGINSMVFNPNPDIPVLVVSYQDGKLCLFDYVALELQLARPGVYANTMTCSPDGRSLVIGSNQGLIELFDFERDYNGATSLALIYRTNHPMDDTIRGITFTADGLRFIDIRGQQGRVWEPAALVRKSASEVESSLNDSAPGDAASLLPPRTASHLSYLEDPDITSPVVAVPDGVYVIAGNSRGEIVLFSTADAKQVCVLFKHAYRSSVVILVLGDAHNVVASADDSGRVLVTQLLRPAAQLAACPEAERTRTVLDRRFDGAVARILINTKNKRLLVGGRHTDELWEIPSGAVLATRQQEAARADRNMLDGSIHPASSAARNLPLATTTLPRSMCQHPSNPDWFIVVVKDIARIYAWADFAELTRPEGLRFGRTCTNINWGTATSSLHVGSGFVVELFRPSAASSCHLYLWSGTELNPFNTTAAAEPAPEPNLGAVSPAVSDVLGIIGPSTLVFVDANLWICTTQLESTRITQANTTSRIGGGNSLTSAASSRPSLQPASRRPGSWSSASASPPSHARRHFFALSEWKNDSSGGKLRCALASPNPSAAATPGRAGGGTRDVVFAVGHRLVVVKGGLDFSENVNAPAVSTSPIITNEYVRPSAAGGQYRWNVVSGSMHRRSSAW